MLKIVTFLLFAEPVIPQVPRNLTASAAVHTITISWLPPDQPTNEIAGYIVGYGRFFAEVYRFVLTGNQTEYMFTKLGNTCKI